MLTATMGLAVHKVRTGGLSCLFSGVIKLPIHQIHYGNWLVLFQCVIGWDLIGTSFSDCTTIPPHILPLWDHLVHFNKMLDKNVVILGAAKRSSCEP